ncbi:hypothetical protein [Sphingomonas montana]|nr:hypothetical protein [Sphingomonas montana]
MFQSDARHAILSAIGALLLSATCVPAAVGPAPAHSAGATALRY